MKTTAFTSESGGERITVHEALRRRRIDGGKARNVVYWSTHRVGERIPMHLVHAEGRQLHFAENSKGGNAGGEETLEHWLFKHALATLERVQLKMEGQSHVLTLHRGSVEARYEGVTTAYRADAHWRFTANTFLDKEWGNEVYVEVHHAHPVPGPKLDALKLAGLPVIEVSIPDFLAFGGGEEAGLAQQTAHIARVHRFLNEAERYFLPAVVLHGPIAPLVAKQRQALAEAKQAASVAQAALEHAQRHWAEQLSAHRQALLTIRSAIPSVPSAATTLALPAWSLTGDLTPNGAAQAEKPSSASVDSKRSFGDPGNAEHPDTRWWRRAAWVGLIAALAMAAALAGTLLALPAPGDAAATDVPAPPMATVPSMATAPPVSLDHGEAPRKAKHSKRPHQ